MRTKSVHYVQLFVTLWMIVPQAPLSMGFSRQEYWRGMPFPPPGDLLNPGINPRSLLFPAWAGEFFTTSATREAPGVTYRRDLGVLACKFHVIFQSVLPSIRFTAKENQHIPCSSLQSWILKKWHSFPIQALSISCSI